MKKRYIAFLLAFVIIAAVSFSACKNAGDEPPPAQPGEISSSSGGHVETGYQSDMQKDLITIRAVRPSTGPNAIYEQTAFGPQYRMWEDEINNDGGLYIKSLDRKLLLDVQVYDDGSDIAKTAQLFEQLCLDEKPDLMLAPEGTAALLACSPIAQKYDYLLLTAEGGASELEKSLPPLGDNRNTFSILNYSDTQIPALVKLFEELGVESVFCVYVDDLYGIEFWGALKPELDRIGVDVKGLQSVPFDGDFDSADVVNTAKNSDADAFLVFAYQSAGISVTLEAAKLGYNPKLYLMGPGGAYDFFGLNAFGDPDNVSLEGMISWGAWNEKSTAHGAKAKEYNDKFRDYWIGKGMFWKNADGSFNPDGMIFQDWWGHICYYSALQILQQAVENAGELKEDGRINNLTLVDYVTNNSFNTVMNPGLRFSNNILYDDMYLGNIGQWQNGIFEVIDADDRRTADPIYPKPPWPKN